MTTETYSYQTQNWEMKKFRAISPETEAETLKTNIKGKKKKKKEKKKRRRRRKRRRREDQTEIFRKQRGGGVPREEVS